MFLQDRNGNEYLIIFEHPGGYYYTRNLTTGQERWIQKTNRFYKLDVLT